MIIGFDARFMSVPGGLGRYCRELLIELTAQNIADTYVIIVKNIPEDFPPRTNIRWVVTPIHWYTITEQFSLGRLMNAQKDVQLWHIPHWNIPITLQKPFVMTFHDFIFEEFPTHNNTMLGMLRFKIKWLFWRAALAINLARARAIMTVSEYVRSQIVERFPHVTSKIRVTLVGLTRLPASHPPHFAVHEPFFLMVGNSYPHKNHALILRMLEIHGTDLAEHFYHLTHRDRFSEELERTIQSKNLDGRVHIVFDAPDTTLAWMYEHCEALILPSLSEGFGIPPLEAFSYGKPAIVAKTSSLPEILGDHAYWFDPRDPEQLFTAIQTSKSDSTSASLSRREHAAKFTWHTAALSTQKIYKSVL